VVDDGQRNLFYFYVKSLFPRKAGKVMIEYRRNGRQNKTKKLTVNRLMVGWLFAKC